MSATRDEVVQVNWYIGDLEDSDDSVDSIADRLRETDPGAEVEVHEPRPGILPGLILGWIAVAIGVTALANEVREVVCRHQKKGSKLDTRENPPAIKPDPEVPKGKMVVIDKDGKTEVHDVCAIDTPGVTDLLKGALG